MSVFLLSPPRADWRVHGNANPFSQGTASPAGAAPSALAPGAALREWVTLADEIEAAGGVVCVLPAPTDDATLTGLPYVAEAGYLGSAGGRPLFLLPNVKPAHRRGEAPLIEAFVRAWGLPTRTVPVPWEGQGDVIDVGGGRSVCTSGDGPQARTSPAAYEHVAPFLPGPSVHVRFHADPWFHGNTFLASFTRADGTDRVVVVCEAALFADDVERMRAFLPDVRFVTITRDDTLRYGTNALQVGARVLAPAGAPPALLELWRSLDLEVRPLQLPALFGRGGGAAVCLTNRLAVAPADVPAAARWSAWRERLAR